MQFLSQSPTKISVNPQIPKERFENDRNALFAPFKQDFSPLGEFVTLGLVQQIKMHIW